MEPVRSTRNARVTAAVRLHRARERTRTGRTLLEGPHLLEEARQGGAEIVEIFGLGRPQPEHPRWVEVTQDVLGKLAGTKNPRGPVAVLTIPDRVPIHRDHMSVHVNDPGNAGTLIRIAAAFALDVVFREGSVDPWSPKVLRAGAGAHFRTRIGLPPAAAGTIATVVEGGIAPDRLADVCDPGRIWEIAVGSEAHGLAPSEVAAAEVKVTIPMPGDTESLNAAVAGAIVAYEFARWRKSVGGGVSTR